MSTIANIALFCLVDGGSTSNAFSLAIPSTETVSNLKKLIKTDKTPEFDDIDAKMLRLWRVSVPVLAANKHDEVKPDFLDSKEELLPTDKLSAVFTETPATRTVHIIVRRPPPDYSSAPLPGSLLSRREVLNRRLPDLPYRCFTIPSHSTTVNAYSAKPTKVKEWKEFQTEMRSRIHPCDRIFDPADFRLHGDLVLSNEESVGIALNANVYHALNRLMPERDGRIGMHIEARVIGQPNRVYYRSAGEIRLLIEIKTRWALAYENLVKKYNADVKDLEKRIEPQNPTWRQVEQIFGYLSCNELRYGVLTTYHQTWFMKRDGGTLHISPSIRYDDGNPTLLECYMHHMELTRQDPTSPATLPPLSSRSPPESPPDSNDDSSGSD